MLLRHTILAGVTLAAFCLAIAATDGIAKPKHGKKHSDSDSTSNVIEDVADVAHTLISLADQTTIRDYMREHHRPSCPPGLAKKRNGCLPPGIARKYTLGKPLPKGIAAKRLPDDLLSKLRPIAGYQYRQIDNDIVLISEATQTIADAVTLLSALK